MKRGSITPFCALSLMLVASFLLVLLESARVYTLDRFATLKAESGIDSVCAEFQPLLWQQYGLLFLDGAYGTEYFSMDYVSETLTEQIDKSNKTKLGLNLLSLEVSEVTLMGYALATDNRGEVFLNYVAEREKENLPIGIAEDIYEQYQKGKYIEQEYRDTETEIAQAQQTLEELTTANQQEKTEGENVNILGEVFSGITQMKSAGTLNLIFGKTDHISAKSAGSYKNIEKREKSAGNMPFAQQKDWYRKLLVLNYMEQYFSDYCSQKEEHCLCYEMEYVLCGKNTDAKNLSGTLDRILLLREACNIASLLLDEGKMSQAKELASVIGILAGENPAAVEVIQAGIIVAWAYMESVLDVRTLVAGEKIAFVKSKEEWTADVRNIPAAIMGTLKAKNCENGMNYTDYIKQLLFFADDRTLAYRMMEAMEFTMHENQDYVNCFMNQMIVALQYRIDFCTEPLFYSLAVIGDSYEGKFYFRKTVNRSYIP